MTSRKSFLKLALALPFAGPLVAGLGETSSIAPAPITTTLSEVVKPGIDFVLGQWYYVQPYGQLNYVEGETIRMMLVEDVFSLDRTQPIRQMVFRSVDGRSLSVTVGI